MARISSDERSAIYFICGKLAKNLRSQSCVEFLVSQCSIEKNKNSLGSALTLLGEIPEPLPIDLTSIHHLTQDSRWLVRHAAIMAMACSDFPQNEDVLLQVLERPNDLYDIIYAQASLGKIGSRQSLDALRANLSSRKRDVKVSAKIAIERIEARWKVR